MRRMTFAVAATTAALCALLFTASVAGAQAPAATIDAEGTAWQPPNVTVTTGETVRWTFAGETLPHNVESTSSNWSLDSPVGTGQGPVDHTFTAPGVYTFICEVHPGSMTGSVTVEDPGADPLEKVLVFSKTQTVPVVTFRHSSIDEGIAAIQELGAANDFEVVASEDAGQFTDANLAQYDAVVFLSTTGDILDDAQQDAFERYMQLGGGFVGIHSATDTEYGWAWYGEMIGGYFRNHPPGTPTATVNIEDGDEPSTEGLPNPWTRTDEWYNFQSPVNPVAGGGGVDYSPRDSGVKVLATVDEATYDEQDGNTTDDDHPVAWCSDFDGGRMWYTALGHTEASFGTGEGNIRQHILGGLETVTDADEADCGEPRQSTPSAADFEKVTLDDDTEYPFALDIAPDGRVFYIERNGELNIWKPDLEQTVVAGNIPVYTGEENGLMGIQLAPDFDESGWIYLTYAALPESSLQQRVSRFQMQGDQLVMSSEQVIITWQHQRDECCHSSGELDFGPDGSLYISTGDNTNPFASDGFTPIDERPGRQAWDAQRTSANTNDLNGKFIRVRPMETIAPGATPGIGSTYTIPAGNLYQTGTALTRPEIFAMGFRNPFRFTVDSETGWLLMGDYGPDSRVTLESRGPQGSVEFNVIPSAGNYGWPYCVRQNVPYVDYTFPTGPSGDPFNCAAPVNNSPNNTGLTNLPAARPATMWMGYTELDARFPGLGGGGAPMGGPRYHFDPDNPSVTKFPEFYDDEWFIGEWNNGWIKHATLDGQGNATDVRLFPYLGAPDCQPNAGPDGCYKRPMDMEFGPDGSLYLVEWGSDDFGGNQFDSGIYRIDYVAEGRRPIAHAAADPTNGQEPLEVDFSSAGSLDPDGTSITYEWNFGDGSAPSTDPNPTHTYTTPGTYTARLRVTDQSGATGVDNLQIVVGNTAPEVTITIPENGQFAEFGDEVPYEITVTDAEDGTTADGSISCDDVTLIVALGHDQHEHPLSQHQGCEGTFETLNAGGHGEGANTYTKITAVYTDEAQPGGAIALTGRDTHTLPRKRQQAEFFDTTGRAPGAVAGGDPGVGTETTGDTQGGGLNIGFIENGDYVSYEPMNLKDINSLRFRVASAGAGGTIDVRTGAPDGPLVATTELITPTGGWQVYKTVELALTDPPAGTHELFFVFRHPTDQGGLMNLNWIQFVGKGAATTAAPEVTATADPASGTAPLEVQFDAEGTDIEGGALTYEWDFGVAGTSDDTSTEEDPTYTYQQPGTYTARVTVTDPEGAEGTAAVQVRVTTSDQCPTGPVRSDEFEGDALDTNRWTVIRPDSTRPPTVSGGNLNFPIDNGSIYGTGTSARNIVVQPLPAGEVEVTAKITTEPLTQDFQQAGLRVYADDNNWASVHMIHANGGRDFEFIWESNGTARNEGADKLGGIPDNSPLTYWVRLVSDGAQLTAFYSFDGEEFLPVGRPGSLATFQEPQIGPVALSDQAPTHPVARFDWVRFNPDGATGGGGGGSETELFADQFDGGVLGSSWEVVRGNQALTVSGGALRMPAATGDLYQGNNTAANLVLRETPASGPWTATAKINFEGVAQYQQAGIILRGDDDNYVKFGRIAHTTQGGEKFEFIHEANATPDNTSEDSQQQNLPEDFPDDYWVQLRYDGTTVTGWYSQNGTDYTRVGRAWPLPAAAKLGVFAFGSNATGTAPEAAFDSFRITRPGGPAGPSRDDEFDGSTLDKSRWDAIVRENTETYEVAGGELTITTEAGDIYQTPNSNPRNFILQDASHAGADWTIETKLSGTINGGWGQGGLLAYGNDGNYVKLDAIADNDFAGNRINRLELRTEVDEAASGPPGQADPAVPEGTSDIWLRLKKTGTSYAGEYSFDGTNWTPMGAVTNAIANPDFGVFALGPQPNGVGDTVSFDYFLLDGRDSDGCECQPGEGDEFDGATLDKTRWNGIIREDESKYALAEGQLRVTTVAGDIYEDGDEALTRNFFLQTADHADDGDWTIETQVGIADIAGGYEQGGLMAYVDKDNYVKFDAVSDANTSAVNRLELRSEVDSNIQTSPADIPVPAGTTDVWLRLTKEGTSYRGEYSFDGQTWTALASPVVNAMASPRFGIFTLGPQVSGHVVTFEYFEVDGERGCEPVEPPNRAPQVENPVASPSIGFGPLEVDFTVEASDPDDDELTYSWDFDGDEEEDSTEQNPTHTFTEPGEHEVTVTVSDGEREVTRSVTVTVLEQADDEARFRVLVFSKTAGFRHDSIDEGHAAIEALGQENNFQVDHTEDATAFRDGILNRYDAVVFLSTTGDVLNATQQRAFERFIQAGNGYAGVHAAADTEYDWNWYGHLVGGYFLSHPPGTPDATVHVEDGEHHSTEGIPTPWERTDEWYNYRSPDYQDPDVPDGDYSPRDGGVHVLMTVDEATYDEGDGNDPVADDHPISWCQAYDGGRSWYTGMGHTADSFSEEEYLLHLLGGIETAAGMPGTQGCDPPNEVPSVLAAADPDTGRAPLIVRFSAAGSDADGDQLTYAWEFGDGQRSFRRNPTHVYLTPGQYTAKVTVTDGKGGSASATVAVNVTNPPGNVAPTVLAAADPASGRPPLTVRFSAAGSDPDGDALTYAWDFGDGGVAYGAQATHVYEERGTYTARVTVTDTKGATGTATVQVRVTRGGGVAGETAEQAGVRIARSYDAERVVDKGLRFRLSCEAFCRVSSTLRMRGGDEERLGRSTARRIGAGKSRQIVVKLDRRVRRNLLDAMGAADMSRLRATLAIRVTTADGTTTVRKAVVLKR